MLAESGGIRRDNCKSRARIAEPFLVGSGNPAQGFVHLDIRFLEGRSAQTKQVIGQEALAVLRTWFTSSAAKLALQITVELGDIARSSYFKEPDGTFTRQ